MQKVDGIQKVRVSLNDGLTILDLKPGNSVTMATLRQVIKNNGFVAKEANVVARGAAKPPRSFVVGGTNEELALSEAPRQTDGSWQLRVLPTKP
jgi:hypothetical protein